MPEPRANHAHKMRLLRQAVERRQCSEAVTITALEPRVLLSTVSIGNVSVTEPAAGIVAANFPLSLDAPSASPISVAFKTSNGTARAGKDYVKTRGSVSFAPGQTSQMIRISIIGGITGHSQKQFAVNLTKASGAELGDKTGTGTIQDNLTPTLSAQSITAIVHGSKHQKARLAVTLSQPSDVAVATHWSTADGSAIAGRDYQAASGSLTFRPGQTVKYIHAEILGDSAPEGDLTFSVNLTDPQQASIAQNAVVTIISAQGPNRVFVKDASTKEGNSGFHDLNFTLSLMRKSDNTVSVDYKAASGPYSVGQYVSVSGTAQFLAGQKKATVSVPIVGDTLFEPNQIFYLQLSDPSGALIGNARGAGTIRDDDPASTVAPPMASVNSISSTEGTSGLKPFVFTVTLSSPSTNPVTVYYHTVDGTAVEGTDYQGGSGAVYFTPGVTSQSVTVQVIGSTLVGPDKTFQLVLDGASYAYVSSQPGVGTILNNNFPDMSIDNVSVTEGNSGTTPAEFTVSLSQPSPRVVTVNYATADGTATLADNDYQSTTGTLTFLPGQTSQTTTVLVNGDTIPESDETFLLNLSNPSNATLTTTQGVGTIVNDDQGSPGEVFWTGDAGDLLWSDAGNWTTHAVPGTGADVVINKTENGPIVYADLSTDVKSVFSNSPINLTNGDLTVDSTIQVNNTFNLAGGELINATILPGGGGQGLILTDNGGTLQNIIAKANIDATAAGAVANLISSIELDGVLYLGSPTSNDSAMVGFPGGGIPNTITGDGAIVFGKSPDNQLSNTGFFVVTPFAQGVVHIPITNGSSLMIGPDITLSGQAGIINAGIGSIQNAGTIEVGQLVIDGPFTNSGKLYPGGIGTAGIMAITGDFTQTVQGSLNIDIAGTTADTGFDVLAVTGAANLDGQLNFGLINNFAPDDNAAFPVITYASATGTFAAVTDANPSDAYNFTTNYEPGFFALGAQLPAVSTYYVDAGNAGSTHDGRSWATAFTNLNDALSVATTGNTIDLAGGTYYPTAGGDRSASFVIPDGVELLGGFAGSANSSNPDAHDTSLYPSILSGDIGELGVNSDNSYHVIAASESDTGITLDGLTITAGNADGDEALSLGGAIFADSATLTIVNCNFAVNSADLTGGAIHASDSTITINGCTFNGNSAGDGGAIYSASTSANITDSTFQSNSASDDERGGGAISNNSDANLSVLGCRFYANQSIRYGGAIENDSAQATITNCLFVGNAATGTQGGEPSPSYGGAIDNEDSSTATIANCTFTQNAAVVSGSYSGGGNAISTYGGSTVYLSNSILFENSYNGPEIYTGEASNITISHSDIQGDGTYPGDGNLNINPQFIRDANSGLDGAWGTADDDFGDLALKPTSPAIDVGDNSLVPAGVTTDIQGNARLINATDTTDTADATVDIGAYELSPIYVDANASGAGNGTTWVNAYNTLTEATTNASAGQTILVAGGTYKPTTGTDRTSSFNLKTGVTILGGFAGSAEPTTPGDYNPLSFPTILSGDIGTPSDATDNSFHVIQASGVDSTAVLDGFMIRDGQADGADDASGGALLNIDASPFIDDCVFTNNAGISGAAIDVTGGAPLIVDCTIMDNTAADNGGAIIASGGAPALVGCTIQTNSAANNGGAIYGLGGQINLLDCKLLGNTANAGGALYSDSSAGRIINCIFSLNTADDNGGAVYTADFSPAWNVLNATFAGNSALNGGALYLDSSHPIQIRNSILAGDSAESGSEIYVGEIAAAPTIDYSDVQQEVGGSHNLDQNPGFARDPGTLGPSDYGDLDLTSSSPALDAGDDSALPAGLITDLQGDPRISGSAVDLGAFERPID